MNRIYRLVWSETLKQFTPAAETARARGKRKSVQCAAGAVLALLAAGAHAMPTGGKVSAGQGAISQSGAAMTVTQSSQSLSLNWQSFSIAPSESVRFAQPSSSAIALNRVLGSNPSEIFGKLQANGQVFLINPNGVLFGPSAQVDVGGLAASTLGLSDAEFLAGRRTFSGTGRSVLNQGVIHASNGYVALIGRAASNQGTIAARLGTVALAAGAQVTLDFSGDHLINVQVEKSALHALAQNQQLIQADGGTVILTTGAKDALLDTVVNNEGVIQARTIASRNGTIMLLAGMDAGLAQVNGTLDASAPNGGDGGAIETSAARVEVADTAAITTVAPNGRTGTWLIDPHDYTVGRGGDIKASTLSSNLDRSNVEIRSSSGKRKGSGDVNVNDAVSWSADTTFTMTASNDVNVNASISATGVNAGIVINPNTANGCEAPSTTGRFNLRQGATINLPNVPATSTDALVIGGIAYTVINSLGSPGSTTGTDLQGISGNTGGNYALGSDINASATAGWNGGAGFAPIEDLSGRFEGLGHAISGLRISRQATITPVGLFAGIGGAGKIADVGLRDASVGAGSTVGALVGFNQGEITNSYATGHTSGFTSGGLVGENAGTVSNSYSAGAVSGNINVAGGLVGVNDASGAIRTSFSTSSVVARSGSGGLVATNLGSVSESFSSGLVSGRFGIGGLVGTNGATGTISNSYSTGTVEGDAGVGGLVASNQGTVSKSYSTGAVTGLPGTVGGLVATNTGTVSDSFWDIQTSGLATSAGGIGMTTKDMQTRANFTSATPANGNVNPRWDFKRVWIIQGHRYPQLRAFLAPKRRGK